MATRKVNVRIRRDNDGHKYHTYIERGAVIKDEVISETPMVNIGRTITSTTGTITAADHDTLMICDNASDITLSIASDFTPGMTVTVLREGDGDVEIAQGSGQTVNGQRKTTSDGLLMQLICYDDNTFVVAGGSDE